MPSPSVFSLHLNQLFSYYSYPKSTITYRWYLNKPLGPSLHMPHHHHYIFYLWLHSRSFRPKDMAFDAFMWSYFHHQLYLIESSHLQARFGPRMWASFNCWLLIMTSLWQLWPKDAQCCLIIHDNSSYPTFQSPSGPKIQPLISLSSLIIMVKNLIIPYFPYLFRQRIWEVGILWFLWAALSLR